MNVLVYSGPGATVDSIKCCTDTLRQLLSPNYCVLSVTASVICNEPWAPSTALLAVPGGADLPYCKELDGKGNEAILKYIRRGGRYIGFCAGGYYGSSRVEFQTGTKLEVAGPRELKFFPGIARGSAFPGFEYGKDTGACACNVSISDTLLGSTSKPSSFQSYFNGGPCFVDAKKYPDVEVLSEYLDEIASDGGDGKAAAVYCKVNKGCAVLTGFHPEFSFNALKTEVRNNKTDARLRILQDLESQEDVRLAFMKAVLEKMGLKIGDGVRAPLISRLNLSSVHAEKLPYLIDSFRKEGFTDGTNQFPCGNDTFEFHDAQEDRMFQDTSSGTTQEENENAIKHVDVFYSGVPNYRYTPHFNHELYYKHWNQEQQHQEGQVGSTILYGEVVTSTSTMLDKNYALLKHLPHGFAAVGTIQVQGRGRGNNVWVNPTGVLAVSTVLKIPIAEASSGATSPIVFVQYLVSLAMVEAIKGYGPGYEDMPIRLKWPNDIYAENPSRKGVDVGQETGGAEFLKIGGVLINTNVVDGYYALVFGQGVNVSNAAPSTSVNLILDALNVDRQAAGKPKLESYKLEVLLAKFMARFERMFNTFRYTGFKEFEQLYYQRWLHNDKIVTLEDHGAVKAKVKGITMDSGLLLAHEVDREGRETGKRFELVPDGNSFDMLRGLVRKKS